MLSQNLCRTSHPPENNKFFFQVEWYLNKDRLEENLERGILVTQTSLVLQVNHKKNNKNKTKLWKNKKIVFRGKTFNMIFIDSYFDVSGINQF